MSSSLILLAAVCFGLGQGFAAGLAFSGTLVRVGNESVSVRLEDRRVVDARLPNTEHLTAKEIAAQYGVGDQVEITCKSIAAVWEEATSRYQSLELTGIRLLRKATPADATEAAGRPTPQSETSGDSAPGARELAHARQVNLQYVANMPNFVADEIAKRSRSGTRSGRWSTFDTVESEITFRGKNVVRQHIRRNGKPFNQPFEALPGFKWYEGFATEINPLFDPKCPTRIEYQGKSKIAGRPAIEYRFSSPVDGCFPFFYFNYQRYNPARTGHFYIDDPGGNVVQLDDHAQDFPADFEFSEREEFVNLGYVKIGQESYWLPVRAHFLVQYSSGTRYKIEVEYKNHRHFESSTNLSFQ